MFLSHIKWAALIGCVFKQLNWVYDMKNAHNIIDWTKIYTPTRAHGGPTFLV